MIKKKKKYTHSRLKTVLMVYRHKRMRHIYIFIYNLTGRVKRAVTTNT